MERPALDRALAALRADLRAVPAVGQLVEASRARGARPFVVGGTVRDALLGRVWHDLDVAVAREHVAPLARALAAAGARLVPLDDQLPTVRAVLIEDPGADADAGAPPAGDRAVTEDVGTLAGGTAQVVRSPPRPGAASALDCIDLSGLRAASLDADLALRDLTINALAVPLEALVGPGPLPDLVDPTAGVADLARRVVRVPAPVVLDHDPARLLRVHRFAAELGFAIHDDTRAAVRARASSLPAVAAERSTEELLRVLAAPDGGTRVAELDRDGLLAALVPEIEPMRGVAQNTFHHLDVFAHTLEACAALDAIRADPTVAFGSEHGAEIARSLADDRRAALVVLSTLLHDVEKPSCRTQDERGVHFYGHEPRGAETAERIGGRLRLPTRHTLRVARWVRDHLRIKDLLVLEREAKLGERTVRRFARATAGELPGLLVLVLADTRATRGPDFPPDGESLLLRVAARVLDAARALDAERIDEPLVRGRDLIERFGLPAGPRLGEILRAVEAARVDGVVGDRAEALAFVARSLDANGG